MKALLVMLISLSSYADYSGYVEMRFKEATVRVKDLAILVCNQTDSIIERKDCEPRMAKCVVQKMSEKDLYLNQSQRNLDAFLYCADQEV